MREFRNYMSPGGLLFLGVPVGGTGVIEGNSHRIYNKQRLYELFNRSSFELLETITTHWGKEPWPERSTWQQQPIFVLRRLVARGGEGNDHNI